MEKPIGWPAGCGDHPEAFQIKAFRPSTSIWHSKIVSPNYEYSNSLLFLWTSAGRSSWRSRKRSSFAKSVFVWLECNSLNSELTRQKASNEPNEAKWNRMKHRSICIVQRRALELPRSRHKRERESLGRSFPLQKNLPDEPFRKRVFFDLFDVRELSNL